METTPPKDFFPRLVKFISAGALFYLGRDNFALILDTEWVQRAEAYFFSPFSSFFLFMQYEYTVPRPKKKKEKKYIYISSPNSLPTSLLFFNCFSLLSLFALLPTTEYFALYSMLVRV